MAVHLLSIHQICPAVKNKKKEKLRRRKLERGPAKERKKWKRSWKERRIRELERMKE
jgi:hypothetical protein